MIRRNLFPLFLTAAILAFGPSAAEPNEKAPSRTEPATAIASAPAIVHVDAGQTDDLVVFDPFAPSAKRMNSIVHSAASPGVELAD